MNWRDLPYRLIGLPFFMILGLPFMVAHYVRWCVNFMRFGGGAFEDMGLIEDKKQPKTTQPKDTKDNVKMLGVIEVMRISSFGIPITTLLSDRIYGEHADKSVTISLIEDGHIPMRFAEDVINESKWAELYRENYKKIWNLE